MEYELLASQSEQEMTKSLNQENEVPMVVWLRGDEPNFSDFSLGADQVMKSLGIRRSRLNQISGRELRVGRTRVDSYIRPVYRPVDVEEYLKWSRPTASHKKSSEVLEEARTKLEQQSERLLAEFSQQFADIAASFNISLQETWLDQRKFSKNLFLNMQKNIGMTLRGLVQRTSLLQNQASGRWEEMTKRFGDLKEILAHSHFLKLGMTKALDLMSYSEKILLETQQGQNKVLEQIKLLHQDLLSLKEEQQLLKKQLTDFASLSLKPTSLAIPKAKKHTMRMLPSPDSSKKSINTSPLYQRQRRRKSSP